MTLVTVVAMVAFTGPSTATRLRRIGCINPTVAGIVGAETMNACGQEAVDICTHASEYDGARAETIVGNCEKQAVKF